MDLRQTTIPRSDQLNADDLLGGPQTFTIADAYAGTSEQPVCIELREIGPARPWKPSKTMQRILMIAWGWDTDTFIGRRVTLKRDPRIKFGGAEVGGIVIAALSHIDEPIKTKLTASKGKKGDHVVEPLRDDAPTASPDRITPDQLTQLVKAMDAAGIEPDARLAYARDITGRAINDATELTSAEAGVLTEALTEGSEA